MDLPADTGKYGKNIFTFDKSPLDFKKLEDLESPSDLKRAIGVDDFDAIPDEVTLWRGIRENIDFELRPGDFLTKDKNIAKNFAKGGRVKKFKVKTKDLLGSEFGNVEAVWNPGNIIKQIQK